MIRNQDIVRIRLIFIFSVSGGLADENDDGGGGGEANASAYADKELRGATPSYVSGLNTLLMMLIKTDDEELMQCGHLLPRLNTYIWKTNEISTRRQMVR